MLLFFNGVDDLIHGNPPSPPARRANSFQQDTRNCNLPADYLEI
jgi:hypothetical protein